MSKIRVVAAVVDTTEIVLYQEDGTKLTIPQGDPRVPVIVDQVLPIVEQGGVAEVNLSAPANHFREFEEMVQGIVRFYRVAKAAVEAALTRQDIPAGNFGPVPRMTPGNQSAVAEIIANAKPTTSPEFADTDLSKDETIVAVVDDGSGPIAVPGAEQLSDQFAHSAKNKDSLGMQNLIKRLSKMIDQRQHSVEDLLRFLERADLPIADDGSIIAYKILRTFRGEKGVYVDCHTGKVKQRVGSYVCVAEELVDKNRRNECSNGLHVARRGYIGTFGGDLVTMIKVAPEDVIVVPHGDANKVRVCGYHILAELPQSAYNRLRSNQPMTGDPDVSRLLAQVLTGNHVARKEEVRITGQRGEGVIITPLVNGKLPKKAKPVEVDKGKGLALDDPKARPKKADPKEISKKISEKSKTAPSMAPAPARPAAKQSSTQNLPAPKATAPVGGSRQEKAAALLATINSTAPAVDRGLAAVNLMQLKKTSKVSYERLGVTISEDELKRIAHAGESAQAEAAEKAAKPKAAKPAPQAKAVPTAKAATNGNHSGSRQEVARQLFKAKDWTALKAHKQKSKVSWEALGFTEAETETIKKRIG